MDLKYDKKCNKYLKIELLDKYKINFHKDNNINFIILNMNILESIWAKYKILCVYDINNNYLLETKDMIIIDKYILDNNIKFDKNKIKNNKDVETQIYEQIFNYDNIGFVKTIYDNKIYYYLIKEIIKI